ncbi:hypothetical protein BN179_3640003 [Clostridioides difficile T6]|nr:hypothetical protein BN179_3640003 [Clostridioides difficile T6]
MLLFFISNKIYTRVESKQKFEMCDTIVNQYTVFVRGVGS